MGEVIWGPIRTYQRYGGLNQNKPLTPEEQRYDDTCKEIDELQRQIAALPLSQFTAAEFMWFSWFVNRLWVFPKQDQLDGQLVDLEALLAALTQRGE
jgi:hypothetical protein